MHRLRGTLRLLRVQLGLHGYEVLPTGHLSSMGISADAFRNFNAPIAAAGIGFLQGLSRRHLLAPQIKPFQDTWRNFPHPLPHPHVCCDCDARFVYNFSACALKRLAARRACLTYCPITAEAQPPPFLLLLGPLLISRRNRND